MRRTGFPRVAMLLLVLGAGAVLAGETGRWPQWRGASGNGVSTDARPPVSWSEERNVAWKVPLEGKGLSTPVVWDGKLFLTTAVAAPGEPHGSSGATDLGDAHPDHEPEPSEGAHDNMTSGGRLAFKVVAYDTDRGRLAWETTVATRRPHESTHSSGSWASPSPVTDGRRVYASFGSAGLYALDLSGKIVWQVDLGRMKIRHGHGEGSSPALHGDTLVVNWDHQEQSFLVALATADGKERWRVPRDEVTSWSSPLVVEHDGRRQVVVSASGRVRGYDLETGEELWAAAGMSGNVVASPVSSGGRVYAGSSYEHRALLAIDLGKARGDVTGGEAVLWTRSRDTPYVPSPVLSGDRLCFLKHYQPLLTCVHGPDGRTLFGPERIRGLGNVYASPVAAAGRLYLVGLDGGAVVLEDADAYRVLATNRLDDSFSASPVPVGPALYLRGNRSLYKIAEPVRPSGGSPRP